MLLEEEVIDAAIADIDRMSHVQMAQLYRFAGAGHLYFTNPAIWTYFSNRFQALGGMTPEISKQIGWV